MTWYQVSALDQAVLQVLTGAVAGGALTLVVGPVKHSLSRREHSE
jgi:hypothetical protein